MLLAVWVPERAEWAPLPVVVVPVLWLAKSWSALLEPNQAGLASRWAMSVPSGRTRMTEVWVMEPGSKANQEPNSKAAKTTVQQDRAVSR